ncbi:hypothetical protein NQ318_020132 [Aromia moschata]|uniref:Methylcrotonoyl-CoA carboxylase subunit alpha, mitochondrial n=1 Tax=Aromia moschata TaxID=1265417 RepID=A0AAV8Z9V5_9CUCU|nr:hypothetical protein NQ318_020132 [Aromia moschata]
MVIYSGNLYSYQLLKWSQVANHNFRRWKSTLKHIEKLLVANRGEIACRVMRTAQRLGIRTVAVYSDADKNALHVSMADEAYEIGPAPASQSYLRGDKLIDVAKRANCQAIHPGYGFLSENVEFAEDCQKNNVIFVGPPSTAIRDMGIKSTSKAIMAKAGVPVIEGYHGENQANDVLKREAKRIGFPIMIKAVRGGGGKGMRIANCEEEFESALESARSESQKAFGDSVVLLEKFIKEPRHVEVQVFADLHGNAVYLYERDCSVQRRHQKIIEEAPAPGLRDDLRCELGAAAVRAAKAVGYVGAGTVEFILDKNDHSFHFMEMNTRLQVEHPVTEMITGTDLVEWQLKIATGERLPLSQSQIPLKGHAFEARIYAEDPRGDFMPGTGVLSRLSTPAPSEDVRIETGVRQGDEVSVHYDPMIAKLIVWGNSRSDALSKLQASLLQYNIAGVETNVNFLLDLSRHPEFSAGNVHTNFIRDNFDSLFRRIVPTSNQLMQAALATVLKDREEELNQAVTRGDEFNPFIVEAAFRINYEHDKKINLKFGGKDLPVEVRYANGGGYSMSCDEGRTWNAVVGEIAKANNAEVLNCTINGIKSKVKVFRDDAVVAVFDENGKIQFDLYQPKFASEDETESPAGNPNRATAPIPGIIEKLLVEPGDLVKKGDPLFVMIAMKMEHIVKANRDAKISKLMFKAGDSVAKDATVIQFEEESQ